MLNAELTLPRWVVKIWWKAHERDSQIAPPDVYGSPTSFPYGKVTGLTPDLRVISETGETPYVCCGYCAAHMACWTAVEGLTASMFQEAHAMRSSAGRGHNAGSNASELRTGADRALGITLEAVAVSEIRDQLRAGFAVAASVQYADLPDYLRVQGNDFGHGVTLYGYRASDDCVGYFDPLWPNGAQGAWTRWSDLSPALWSDGNHSSTVTRWGSPVVEEADMPINATENLRTDFRADVPAGLDWYEDANLDRRGGSFGSAANVTYVGQPVGETVEGGSRAILISTGNLYPDGPRPTIVYVAAGAITPYRDPQTTDVDEALAMRDAEWSEWMLDGSPGSES